MTFAPYAVKGRTKNPNFEKNWEVGMVAKCGRIIFLNDGKTRLNIRYTQYVISLFDKCYYVLLFHPYLYGNGYVWTSVDVRYYTDIEIQTLDFRQLDHHLR